jgi:hypothetical protein
MFLKGWDIFDPSKANFEQCIKWGRSKVAQGCGTALPPPTSAKDKDYRIDEDRILSLVWLVL